MYVFMYIFCCAMANPWGNPLRDIFGLILFFGWPKNNLLLVFSMRPLAILWLCNRSATVPGISNGCVQLIELLLLAVAAALAPGQRICVRYCGFMFALRNQNLFT